MNFTETISLIHTKFEESGYDIRSIEEIMKNIQEGHHFIKTLYYELLNFQKLKNDDRYNAYLKENGFGWLTTHNFPITIEILNKVGVPGKDVAVRIMGGRSRSLVIYYGICPELENFVSLVNWIDSESSKNAWIQIRNLIKNQANEILQLSKTCGIRLPNKIHPGHEHAAKLTKNDLLESLYDWRRAHFLFDDGQVVMSHNSPINFRRIFFGNNNEETFVDIRTSICKINKKTREGMDVSIPSLIQSTRPLNFIVSNQDQFAAQPNLEMLNFIQIFHSSGNENVEHFITKIESATPVDLLGMFHATSYYLLYLGFSRLKILNKESAEKLFSHLCRQVSDFCDTQQIQKNLFENKDWKTIQLGYTSAFTRWIDDELYYIPLILRKALDEVNPKLRDFVVKEFDKSLQENKSICFEKIPLNESGNRAITQFERGKCNRVYSLIRFLLYEKRFINGFGKFYIQEREKEFESLKKLITI